MNIIIWRFKFICITQFEQPHCSMDLDVRHNNNLFVQITDSINNDRIYFDSFHFEQSISHFCLKLKKLYSSSVDWLIIIFLHKIISAREHSLGKEKSSFFQVNVLAFYDLKLMKLWYGLTDLNFLFIHWKMFTVQTLGISFDDPGIFFFLLFWHLKLKETVFNIAHL